MVQMSNGPIGYCVKIFRARDPIGKMEEPGGGSRWTAEGNRARNILTRRPATTVKLRFTRRTHARLRLFTYLNAMRSDEVERFTLDPVPASVWFRQAGSGLRVRRKLIILTRMRVCQAQALSGSELQGQHQVFPWRAPNFQGHSRISVRATNTSINDAGSSFSLRPGHR